MGLCRESSSVGQVHLDSQNPSHTTFLMSVCSRIFFHMPPRLAQTHTLCIFLKKHYDGVSPSTLLNFDVLQSQQSTIPPMQ